MIDKLTLRWFTRDISARGALVANALHDSTIDALASRDAHRLALLFDRTAQDERVFGIGLCSSDDLFARSSAFPAALSCADARQTAGKENPRVTLPGGAVLVTRHSLVAAETSVIEAEPASEMILLHDLSFIERRSLDTRRYLIAFLAALGFVVAIISMFVAQISWRGWIAGARALLRGEVGPAGPMPAELAPLADDLRSRLRQLEDEYRRARGPEAGWTPERLRGLLHAELRGDEIIVVSNREPYIHDLDQHGGARVRRPASGLVTAIEPVMRACSGTWIAHGSGTADRDVVDLHDRVAVPPDQPMYSLRRIWLTPEEEQGYYYGFANEGLWPLCHVAHVRPVFRESDWQTYRAVNQRFAEAVLREARTDDPVVLVQDYHLALVPALVREKLPQATILTFWHIPWPNPESFGICPWRREILLGLLGSTILGFHTKFHCKNFLETVDRFIEARIEHEHSVVAVAERETFVESYPISIEWPQPLEGDWASPSDCRRLVIERHGLPEHAIIGLGVDRFDYTKGIVERLNAVERMLEKYPSLIGRFVFVQVASPTRSSLDEYRAFQQQVERLSVRINSRFGAGRYQPVVFLAEHHDHAQLIELYRAADICVVTSLHDGMNLVCKEYVASRDDEQGVLVLSRFAGAAREMHEALIINPYHVEETADAIYRAARMSSGEQRERMISLRHTVRDFNVFRWAGRMLSDAARWRLRARVEERVRKHGLPEFGGR
ncbi:alpha,alpha-trehalose-phosphate synthase (UDP-forming) [Noviluteimonas dokdonensis]|uniref:alpha,alpha-trehalose-phosphate synthase (UDP-forming) n=1 Tax=Noviluteimonas dokdonensis TaxID=414050 RepID=UPI001929EC9E|nr:trehalose-6-phosphate synthase [Lysobacter dokdonensis]